MSECLVTNIQGYSIHDGPGIRTVVFLKGCSLACQWCCNPECISPNPEMGFFRSLCTRCGKCVTACLNDALQGEKGQLPSLNHGRCTGCGKCAAVCYYQALVLYGRLATVEDVLNTVKRDSIFYEASGGGITISGGEALLHPEFVRDLFERCHQASIHTCIETSGSAAESALCRVLPDTDLVLFDLKHLNSETHRHWTGQPNARILANARLLAASGVEVLFRMPLVPGINDDAPNIAATADFLKGLRLEETRIELMPYHALGKGKHESLGRSYPLADLPSPGPDYSERTKKSFEDLGISCTISS